MKDVIFDEVVETDYGQLDLVWGDGSGFDGNFDRFFDGQVNGLVGAASGDGLYVNLARRSGGSPVHIAQRDAEPPLLDDWEDVVEVSISIPPDAHPTWSTWAGEEGGPLAIPPGDYRVRVSARGRDAGQGGEFADGPVDWYVIELWPAPMTADAILRVTSADATYWHHEAGSRRGSAARGRRLSERVRQIEVRLAALRSRRARLQAGEPSTGSDAASAAEAAEDSLAHAVDEHRHGAQAHRDAATAHRQAAAAASAHGAEDRADEHRRAAELDDRGAEDDLEAADAAEEGRGGSR